ncbi:MAG: ATPase, T2SS/T4P/T4SS family [Thermoplasmatota archaeon]
MSRKSNVRIESSNSDWWSDLERVASLGRMKKPSFSGSWLKDDAAWKNPVDVRENSYVRTEIFNPGDGSGRMFRISPYEYGMGESEIDVVVDSINRGHEILPPDSIMENEKRLRRYLESKMVRNITGFDRSDMQRLARISAQYSVGYGTLEHLLRDERIQDIYVDSPPESTPVYVSIGGASDPEMEGIYPTNIFLTGKEIDRLVSILRYHSDRPFSEANPVLECDLEMYNSRVTVVGPPLSPGGVSIAVRKHSHDPWTLLRLIDAGAVTARSAAFLNLAVDGRSTILVAGPRGAGKTSLLGALLFEVERTSRIISIEDTEELPVMPLREIGYKTLPLLIGEGGNSTAETALRTALRLGESVIVMGEVRGPETRVLYEAMSAGTAGSSVMGTFHADSADSVYKRVVDDMGVSPGSFSATDLVVVCGLVRPEGRRLNLRRVLQIAEVVKEGGPGSFRYLFLYDPSTDSLEPTDELGSSSVVKRIASSWGWRRKDVLGELETRSRMFERALKELSRDRIIRPETEADMLQVFRTVRDEAAAGGWISDRRRMLDECFTAMNRGDE